MKCTLKPIQQEKVFGEKKSLVSAFTYLYDISRNVWKTPAGTQGAYIALEAPTGSGKTVMATAFLEQLMTGALDTQEEFAVLWVSAQPSLNEQTRIKINRMSDLLEGRVVMITNSFQQSQLNPGTIYMLNTQKLSNKSALVKGHYHEKNGYDFYATLANTITSGTKVLLVIDEAHQGMKKTSKGALSIIRKLVGGCPDETVTINGEEVTHSYPKVPFVLGMSATPGRFRDIMGDTHEDNRSVTLSLKDTKESGLVKDTLSIAYTTGDARDTTVLLKRACGIHDDMTEKWRAYTDSTGEETVTPLMIVQVKDKVTDKELVELAEKIYTNSTTVDKLSFGHAIPDKGTIEDRGLVIERVDAEHVADDTSITVLFAKETISTGWDCPRAEVLLSFRTYQEKDIIVQLLGRILRTPLARTIDNNDALNVAHLIAPNYAQQQVQDMATHLSFSPGYDFDEEQLTDVVINAVNATYVGVNGEDEILTSLPSLTIPGEKTTRGHSRITTAIALLNSEGIGSGVKKDTTRRYVKKALALSVEYDEQLAAKVSDFKKVTTGSTMYSLTAGDTQDAYVGEETATSMVDDDFDDESLEGYKSDATKRVGAHFYNAVANAITKTKLEECEDDLIEATRLGQLEAAALIAVDDVFGELDAWCHSETMRLLNTNESDIEHACMGDDDIDARFTALRHSSPQPTLTHITLPVSLSPARSKVTDEGEQPYPAAYSDRGLCHIFADDDGVFPLGDANELEKLVLANVSHQKDFVSFYRNPSSGMQSLTIPYTDDEGVLRGLHPDFVTFSKKGEDVLCSVWDPHGLHLADSLNKLVGAVKYLQEYCGEGADRVFFEYMSAVHVKSDGANTFRCVNLVKKEVQDAIITAESASDVFSEDNDFVRIMTVEQDVWDSVWDK